MPSLGAGAPPDAELPADRVLTLTGLFASLNRAGFAVDTLLEPAADRAEAGEAWSEAMRWVPPTLIVRARKLGI